MAAPAPHNVAALELRQINGMLEPPLLSALRHHTESMKGPGDYASLGAWLQMA